MHEMNRLREQLRASGQEPQQIRGREDNERENES